MSKKYILDGRRVVGPVDLLRWAYWFENSEIQRRVLREDVCGSLVSTVFLGLDHAHGDDDAPQLFETQVFGGLLADEITRCSTWEQAEEMHAQMCLKVRLAQDAKTE